LRRPRDLARPTADLHQVPQTAYENLADEKEKLAALSAADAIVLLGGHRRRIRVLTKEIRDLARQIVTAPLEKNQSSSRIRKRKKKLSSTSAHRKKPTNFKSKFPKVTKRSSTLLRY
jgi:hypothetical protein